MGHVAEQQALLSELLTLAADGRLHPAEPTSYPLERTGDALEDLLGRRVVGKVVLRP